MKYSVIVIFLPLIAILQTTQVKCECKYIVRYYDGIINCTGIAINFQTNLSSLMPSGNNKNYEDSSVLIIKDSSSPLVNSFIFESLNSVEKLYLINDSITDIYPYSFSSMTELNKIVINHNNALTSIKKHTFTGLSDLKILDLSYNYLTMLENINDLTNLEELNVTNNNISKLNIDSFQGMTKLKILNLCNNKLTSLEYINQVHTLEVLNVSFNLIESVINYDFQKLESLKSLDLSNNLLRYLRKDLFINSRNLTELFLRNNSFKSFSNDLFYKSISHVDLSLNVIESFQCDQIQGSVVLTFNYIATVCHFGDNVTYIDFSENDLPTVVKGAFQHLTNLTFLNLTMNYIKTVDVDAFENLHSLTLLSISKNEISLLHVGTFHQLTSLKHLDISWNLIAKLDHGIFTGLKQLTSLDLSHNKMQIIDSSIFYPVSDLAELYLEGNPLLTFDSSDLTYHLSSLRELSISFEKIGCETLTNKLRNFNYEYVNVKQGENVKLHNVNGIVCNPDVEDTSRGVRYREKNVQRAMNFMTTFRAIMILITVAFILLITMQIVSWYHKNVNSCKSNTLKKNASSCSVTLLTENGHD